MQPRSFPKFNGKWRLRPLVTAEKFAESFPPRPAPLRKAILVFNRHVVDALGKEVGLTKSAIPYGDYLSTFLDPSEKTMVVTLGIGAPLTATTVEELATWGIREFLLLGYAGSLRPDVGVDSLVLCTKAIRDEGTSHHYLPATLYSSPDARLTRYLARSLRAERIPFVLGPSWTTDAPYRETRSEARQLSRMGVITVEMEASALFAVAHIRRVKAAAAFVISDVLGVEWSGFQRPTSGYSKLAKVGRAFCDWQSAS
jgi:uridine phosphorylase